MDLSLFNYLADGRGLRFDKRFHRGNLHVLGNHARHQIDVDTNYLVDIQLNVEFHSGFEAGELDRDVIKARLEMTNVIFTLVIGSGLVPDVCLYTRHRDRRARNHPAGSIADRADERSRVDLRSSSR